MDRLFTATLVLSTAATVLLLNIAPGFGHLPGDVVYAGDGVRIMLPFASSALVMLATFGLLRLGQDLARRR